MKGIERLMKEILKEYEAPNKYDKSKRFTKNPK